MQTGGLIRKIYPVPLSWNIFILLNFHSILLVCGGRWEGGGGYRTNNCGKLAGLLSNETINLYNALTLVNLQNSYSAKY